MKKFIFIHFIFFIFSTNLLAKVALVKIIKGEAKVKISDQISILKIDQWVDEGMVITTADKSFVKLVFVDKSTMNIGPKSEVKIEKFNGKEASVFDLVKGQIRSNVSKDYLQNPNQDKSKLLIKTKNAVMGVRGTDFLISTNGITTSTVLFEGEIMFNSLSSQVSPSELEKVVSQGVSIKPGEFSVVKEDLAQPSLPSKLNVKQLELLEKNDTFSEAKRDPASEESPKPKSIVPKGLNGEVVSNNSNESLKNTTDSVTQNETPVDQNIAKGFKDGDKIKPANGSFIHLESGTIVPPASDAVWDANSNTFMASTSNGSVSADGNFLPPEGITITDDGKFLAVSGGQTVEIAPPTPVMSESKVSLRDVASTPNENLTLPSTEPNVNLNDFNPYTSPSQTNYSTSAPTETQVTNQSGRGNLNITVIDR
jgi:hypothetical protein